MGNRRRSNASGANFGTTVIMSKDGGKLPSVANETLLPATAKEGDAITVLNYNNTGFQADFTYNSGAWGIDYLNQDVWTRDADYVKLINYAPTDPRYNKTKALNFKNGATWTDFNTDYDKIQVENWATGYGYAGNFIHEIDWNITRNELDTNINIYGIPIVLKFKSYCNAYANQTFDIQFNYQNYLPTGSRMNFTIGQLGASNYVPNVFVGFKPVDGNTANDKLVVLVAFGGNQNRFTVDLFARYFQFGPFDIYNFPNRTPSVYQYGATPAYATGFNGLAGTLGTDCKIITFKNTFNNVDVLGTLGVTGGSAAIVNISDVRLKDDINEKEYAMLKEFASKLSLYKRTIRKYKSNGNLVIGFTAQEVLEACKSVNMPQEMVNQFVIESDKLIDENGNEFDDVLDFPESHQIDMKDEKVVEEFSKQQKEFDAIISKRAEEKANSFTPMLQITNLVYDIYNFFK